MAAWHWNAGTSNWDRAGSSWERNDGTPYNWCEASGVNQYSEFGLGDEGSPTAVTLKAARSRTGWLAAWVPAVLVLSVALGGAALLRRRDRQA
jgi:hypothetical protein